MLVCKVGILAVRCKIAITRVIANGIERAIFLMITHRKIIRLAG